MAHIMEGLNAEISKFFPSCPLCQKEKVELQWNADWYGRDYIMCSNCNAKWHIYYLGNLKWAKLTKTGSSGKGEDYLGTEHEPAFWYSMIEKKPNKKHVETEAEKPQTRIREPIVMEKETIIKEKKTIYKVKCPYCGKSYNEVLDACPHCGGRGS